MTPTQSPSSSAARPALVNHNTTIYKGHTIKTWKSTLSGFRGWLQYSVTIGDQGMQGITRAGKREAVDNIKWHIDNNCLTLGPVQS